MSDPRHADRREPETPEGAFDLHAAAGSLLEQARGLDAGRSARSLTPGPGGPVKQTLMALCEGRRLEEHRAPGPATLQVLQGTVVLGTEGSSLRVPEGHWAAIPDQTHDLQAETDATVLLTVALPS